MLLWIVFEKKMVKMQSNIVKAAVSMFVGNVNEEVTYMPWGYGGKSMKMAT